LVEVLNKVAWHTIFSALMLYTWARKK
jgi:hypothetical protein